MLEEIHIGFTGTRKGMSKSQKMRLSELLTEIKSKNYSINFHHGACKGADSEADLIARNFGCKMYIHPSNDRNTRIHCEESGDIVFNPKPPLVRDQDIVNVIEMLIAAPFTDKEIMRSGTWTTVRYARKRNLLIEEMKR